MKVKFIKQVDHIEEGTVREFEPKLCEQLIEGGWAIAYKEEKAAASTKELKTPVKTKAKK